MLLGLFLMRLSAAKTQKTFHNLKSLLTIYPVYRIPMPLNPQLNRGIALRQLSFESKRLRPQAHY